MHKMPWNKKTEKCPDPMRGEECRVCGGMWICLESWRKGRTNRDRVKRYNELPNYERAKTRKTYKEWRNSDE